MSSCRLNLNTWLFDRLGKGECTDVHRVRGEQQAKKIAQLFATGWAGEDETTVKEILEYMMIISLVEKKSNVFWRKVKNIFKKRCWAWKKRLRDCRRSNFFPFKSRKLFYYAYSNGNRTEKTRMKLLSRKIIFFSFRSSNSSIVVAR